jgi:hypothetical protein
MHPEDLMKSDLLSQILLLGSGCGILATLLLIAVAAVARTSGLF